MPNPHPFYRFQKAWNAGFYPDNVTISSLLNELYLYLDVWIPANAIGLTFNELKRQAQLIVDGYNIPTRLGGFTITSSIIPDSPNYEYNIYIANIDLSSVDANQVITINGFFNPTTKIVVGGTVLPFTPGTYFGTFDPALIPTEEEVARALQIVEQNGSAFFPPTYLYNHTTNIATSGLARGQNWTTNSSGESTRVVPIGAPLTNARTFQMPSLSPDEKFIISFMERIIATSLADDYYAIIEQTYQSFPAPTGWTKSWSYSSTTYERIQIGFEGPDGRSFAMVGRLDGGWLWQRFVVNDSTVGGIPNFLITYSATTPLPYNTDGAAYYVYFSEWFDFEFVEFTEGCYESPEFYPMPSIQGDWIQFNVPQDTGNIIGLDRVKVGLFSESGAYIKTIGDAYKADGCFTQLYASGIIPVVADGCFRLGMFDEPTTTCNLEFFYLVDAETFLSDVNANPLDYLCFGIYNETTATYVNSYGTSTLGGTLTAEDIVNFANTIPGMTAFYTGDIVGSYFTFTWQIIVDCDSTYTMKSYIGDIDFNEISPLFTSAEQVCECQTQYYLYSLSNIIKVDSADCFSRMIEFWGDNDTIAQGFEYISNWKQRIRIGLNGGGEKPVIEESLYRQSNGVHRRPQNKQDLSIDLHTDFFDLETQLAMTDATRHPYLVWNGQSIFVKGDLEVATIQDFTTQSSFETLSQMKFQALKQGFQPKNSSCLTC